MSHEITLHAFCYTSTFVINGIKACEDDFGEKFDHDPENAEDYGCGDMRFDMKHPTSEVLEKYSIDELEYWTIANKLADGLSFGSCGWCI